MKPQTPPHRSLKTIAGMLAFAASALFLMSSCHHGTYGQRYVHPHVAIDHAHTPYHYGPPTKPGQTWHRQLKKGKRWPYHYHTTWADLCHGPRDYRLRTSW